MADLNFTAEIAGLKARNAELIQKIAEDEANLNSPVPIVPSGDI